VDGLCLGVRRGQVGGAEALCSHVMSIRARTILPTAQRPRSIWPRATRSRPAPTRTSE
jgi:hypothetical protein